MILHQGDRAHGSDSISLAGFAVRLRSRGHGAARVLPCYRLNLTRYLAGDIAVGELPMHPEEWYAENRIDLALLRRHASAGDVAAALG